MLKGQRHLTQIAFGFHQNQRTVVLHHSRCMFSRHMHCARFSRHRSAGGGDLVGVRIHPLQPRTHGDLSQLGRGQLKGRNLGQRVRGRGHGRRSKRRSSNGCRCLGRGGVHRRLSCRRFNGYRFGGCWFCCIEIRPALQRFLLGYRLTGIQHTGLRRLSGLRGITRSTLTAVAAIAVTRAALTGFTLAFSAFVGHITSLALASHR